MDDNDSRQIINLIDYAVTRMGNRFCEAVASYDLPSVIYRPTLSRDGNKWIVLLGDDLQSGVVGVGDSPALAMHDFDRAWYEKISGIQKGGE